MFCLDGDTEVLTEDGWRKIKDLEGTYNKFVSVDDNGNTVLSNEAKVIETKKVTELIEIELENGSVIKCTPEHRFLLKDGQYKEAQYLTEDDDLFDFEEFWQIKEYWKQFGIKSEYYLQRYINFIKSIKDKGKRELDYHENHHIIPKSFVENNITVELTGREHFIAHWILMRAFGGKMTYAFNRLCESSKNKNLKNRDNFKISSRVYEELRREHRKEVSKTHKGKKISDKQKKIMSETCKKTFTGRKWSNERREEFSLKMKDNPQGCCLKDSWTDERRKLQSKISKKTWSNEEFKKNMSEKRSGERNGMFGKRGELSPNFNKIQITNSKTGQMIYVSNDEIDDYLSNEWFIGRSKECCDNISKSKIKSKYIYDNKEFYGINSKNGIRKYLQENGYPKISQGTIERIACNIEMPNNPYPELIGKIRKEDLK